jgi:hypothetical protein
MSSTQNGNRCADVICTRIDGDRDKCLQAPGVKEGICDCCTQSAGIDNHMKHCFVDTKKGPINPCGWYRGLGNECADELGIRDDFLFKPDIAKICECCRKKDPSKPCMFGMPRYMSTLKCKKPDPIPPSPDPVQPTPGMACYDSICTSEFAYDKVGCLTKRLKKICACCNGKDCKLSVNGNVIDPCAGSTPPPEPDRPPRPVPPSPPTPVNPPKPKPTLPQVAQEIMGHLQAIIDIACRNKALSPDLEQLCNTTVPSDLNSAVNILPIIKDTLAPEKKKEKEKSNHVVVILVEIALIALIFGGIYLFLFRHR